MVLVEVEVEVLKLALLELQGKGGVLESKKVDIFLMDLRFPNNNEEYSS